MAGRGGSRTSEFGADPGAFKVWFGEHVNKRFDEVPKSYRTFLVKRSETNKAPNLIRFKRLCDEYNALQAKEPRKVAKGSSAVASRLKNNTNQRNPRHQIGTKKASPNISSPNRPQSKLIGKASNSPAVESSTEHNSSRRHEDTRQDAKADTNTQTAHKTPRLKQTQLSFIRTPLGGVDANKSTSLTKPASTTPAVSTSRKVPCKAITPSRGSSQEDGGSIVKLLSTSKGDCPRDKSLGTKRPAAKAPSSQSHLGDDDPQTPIPRPAKRQKITHQSESVPIEASSSQSSVHSPWRPLRLVVVSQNNISV